MTDAEENKPIISDPEILSGQPCIAGTRVPARMIAKLQRDHGIDEVFAAYPFLSAEQVRAAWQFARKCGFEEPTKYDDPHDKHGKEMAQRVARDLDLEDWDDLAKLIREEIQRHVDAKCATLRAERDGLAARLKPFSDAIAEGDGTYVEDQPDEMSIWDTDIAEKLTLGDFRRARAALNRGDTE